MTVDMSRDASRKAHLAIIGQRFPGIAPDAVVMESGWDHHVYIVGQRVVYRFPRQPRTIAPVRKLAMDALDASGTVPFPLPIFEIEHDERSGLWYEVGRAVSGIAFTTDVAATFAADERLAIARQLAAFLKALHGFPLDRARAFGMDEMDPYDYRTFMEFHPNVWPTVQAVLWPVIQPRQRAWIETLFEGFIAQRWQTPLPLAVRHSDLFPYHVFVDPNAHRLSGVIDFGWRIADPANDFKAFSAYGPAFVDELYAHYHHPVDDEFDARRLFYTGHDEVFELVRGYQLGDEARIAHHNASLDDWIRANPHPTGGWWTHRS